jgi:uncharacterized protein DUF6401
MAALADMWAEHSARRFLARLTEQVGTAGLAAAAAAPALLATIDQHAAAVRDIVAFGVEGSAVVAGAVLLAGYARGLVDHAKEQGWLFRKPDSTANWFHADWLTMRLVGVCALARSVDQPGYSFRPALPHS